MSERTKTKFRITTDKCWDKAWSFGISFSHFADETYFHLGFFKWSINIGIMYVDEEEYFVDTII